MDETSLPGLTSPEAGQVQRLESLAQQLVARLRDDDPAANLRWLRAELGADPSMPVSEVERLVFVLAAAVPTSQTWWDLTEWARTPEEIETRKAMRRQALINATARRGRRQAA